MRWKSRLVDITEWHRVFAWWPTLVGDGDEVVWLEYVERKTNGFHPEIGLMGVEYRKCQEAA